jgi:DNA-binding cell septation regulator SpoVG
MHISIEHFDGKYPSFNVSLSSTPDKEPFLVVKGCRIANGKKGDFVSWPATKGKDDKWWNHVYASEAFADKVMEAYNDSKPKKSKATDVDEDRIPF